MFAVGNRVARKNGQYFASGSCVDTEAVVISIDPFILVSEEGDMRWSLVKPEEVYYIGVDVKEEILQRYYMRRLLR